MIGETAPGDHGYPFFDVDHHRDAVSKGIAFLPELRQNQQNLVDSADPVAADIERVGAVGPDDLQNIGDVDDDVSVDVRIAPQTRQTVRRGEAGDADADHETQ